MTKLTLVAALLLALTPFSFAKRAEKTYTGEVMDSACAKMGNHDAGYKMTGTNTPKDCTLACVKSGSKLVLYDPTTKTTYQLDDQEKAKELAGQNVKVEGTLNKSTKTIHVDNIQSVQ